MPIAATGFCNANSGTMSWLMCDDDREFVELFLEEPSLFPILDRGLAII